MASCAETANIETLVSRNEIREKLTKTLRLYVGRGRRYSVRELSEATGVPERCIEAAKSQPDDPEYRPLTLENLASLSKFLGSAFASAYLELSGLGAFDLMHEQPPLPKVLDACASPSKLTREDHIRKAREHLNAADEAGTP